MNDRTRAIDLLKRARDLLAEQLTERVLQASDGILEDALGMSYMGEIDAIYEQLGVRLAHLNSLIANLPAAHEPMADDPSAAVEPATTAATNPSGATSGMLALPAPRASFGLPVPFDSARLQGLAIAVSGTNSNDTGIVLAELFGLPADRGAQCWRHFLDRLERDPQTSLRAAQLLSAIESNNVGAALVLLWECFGLRGLESLSALQHLKARMTTA